MLTTLGPTADSVQTPKLESLFQKPWQIFSSNQHNVLNPTAHSNITQQKLTNQQPGASGSLLKPRLNAGRCVEQTGSLHHLRGRSGNKSNDNNNLNFFNTPQKTQFSRDFFCPLEIISGTQTLFSQYVFLPKEMIAGERSAAGQDDVRKMCIFAKDHSGNTGW